MSDNAQIVAERRGPMKDLLRDGCLGQHGEIAMSRYSMAKVDNEYVVQAEGQSILRISSRRQAAKLLSTLIDRERDLASDGASHQRCRNPQPPRHPQPKRGPKYGP